MTDSELSLKLKNVSKGDIKAFEDIYNDMKKPVMTVIMIVVGNRETAEDLLQEVFVKLYRSPPKDVSKPRAYIFKTAGNLAIDSLRAENRTVSLDECEGYIYADVPDSGEKLDIERALDQLDEPKRRIVTLHINAGLKFREIAEIMDIPLGTAIWRYNDAIKKLRELLS